MKMYVLIKESVPLGLAIVGAAHSSLAAFRKFEQSPEMQAWIDGPFYKVICKVSDREFEDAKKDVEDHVVLSESALDGAEVSIAFKPREDWPKWFKFLRLYR